MVGNFEFDFLVTDDDGSDYNGGLMQEHFFALCLL